MHAVVAVPSRVEILDVFVYKSSTLMARVLPLDPLATREDSFLVIIPRQLRHLFDKLHQGLIVLVSAFQGLKMPAIVEIVDDKPQPIQLPTAELQAQHPDDFATIHKVVQSLEVHKAELDSQRSRITALLALLR